MVNSWVMDFKVPLVPVCQVDQPLDHHKVLVTKDLPPHSRLNQMKILRTK